MNEQRIYDWVVKQYEEALEEQENACNLEHDLATEFWAGEAVALKHVKEYIELVCGEKIIKVATNA